MAWRYHGRALTDTLAPNSYAICDRCYMQYNHNALQWQWDFRGTNLQNLRILVCKRCLDTPSPFYRPIIVPPDPLPIQNPRPEMFAQDENTYRVTQNGDRRVTQGGEPRVINGGGEEVP